MRLLFPYRAAAVAVLALTTSACSSALSSLPAPSYGVRSASLSDAADNAATHQGYTTLRLRIWVPGRTQDSAAHRVLPAYVSSATRKVAVSVQGVNQKTPATQKLACTAVCSGKIVAPLGVDLITLQLEDKKNRVLSRGSATVLVFKTNGNVFDFTLDGVPASVAVVPESNVLPVVPASTGYLNFDARDADGRIITPDGHYVDANGNPLVFDIKSSNAAYRLAVNTVSAPGAPIPFSYNGKQHVGKITLTAKAARGIKTTVKFHPATLTLVPGVAARISPPLPVHILSATQVPRSSSSLPDPNVIYVLGNSGGQSAALAFNIVSRTYGLANPQGTGAPFQSPPVDLGTGTGFSGYLQYGNSLWNPEYVNGSVSGTAGGGNANPCTYGTPIGQDTSGTLFCQSDFFPGGIYDSTHSVFVGTGQDRKIEKINGINYFVTVNSTTATNPGINVYANGSTTPVAGAVSVGANVTQSTTAYYGNADGTVTMVGGGKVATFAQAVLDVIGYNSSIYAFEQGGVFGVSAASGTFQSAQLPIKAVTEIVTGVNGVPMLVESDGTLDVIGI